MGSVLQAMTWQCYFVVFAGLLLAWGMTPAPAQLSASSFISYLVPYLFHMLRHVLHHLLLLLF